MGSLSTYARNKVLDHIFKTAAYIAPVTVYLALCTTAPTEASTGSTIVEPTYTGYARKAITFGAADLAGRSITQNAQVSFDKCTGGTSTVTHYAICDALTTGNVLGFGELTLSKTIVNNNTPTIPSGEAVITAGATGGCSNYVVQKVLDFVFRNQAFVQPTLYCGITTATVANTNTGSTITEVSGTGYARTLITDFTLSLIHI